MKMEWWQALSGGVLIGISVSLFLGLTGRVTGISGILSGLIFGPRAEAGWRVSFLFGLVFGGLVMAQIWPPSFTGSLEASIWTLIPAGLLVGFGTSMGSGCTSGHGVCGISRLSPRSLVATITFILAGVLSVAAYRGLDLLP
ncbi:MAG: YeeE/YedE family protein [Bdellovibrionales bacterium]